MPLCVEFCIRYCILTGESTWRQSWSTKSCQKQIPSLTFGKLSTRFFSNRHCLKAGWKEVTWTLLKPGKLSGCTECIMLAFCVCFLICIIQIQYFAFWMYAALQWVSCTLSKLESLKNPKRHLVAGVDFYSTYCLLRVACHHATATLVTLLSVFFIVLSYYAPTISFPSLTPLPPVWQVCDGPALRQWEPAAVWWSRGQRPSAGDPWPGSDRRGRVPPPAAAGRRHSRAAPLVLSSAARGAARRPAAVPSGGRDRLRHRIPEEPAAGADGQTGGQEKERDSAGGRGEWGEGSTAGRGGERPLSKMSVLSISRLKRRM